MGEMIPDDAIVVRGGRNRPEDIERALGTHPCGISGVSVQCAVGISIELLAAALPHGHVGITTVQCFAGYTTLDLREEEQPTTTRERHPWVLAFAVAAAIVACGNPAAPTEQVGVVFSPAKAVAFEGESGRRM